MSDGLIIGLAFSIIFNVLIIFFLLFTGIGKDSWQRFVWKKLHRRGGYSYSLMATKDGNLLDIFKKVDKGTFTYNDQKYIREPTKQIQYRGIPANLHIEGLFGPVDIWGFKENNPMLSCGEAEEVILAKQNEDLFALLDKYKGIAIIAGVVLIGAVAAAAYFGYMNYEVLRDFVMPVANEVIPN